jgi:hypothetical protein
MAVIFMRKQNSTAARENSNTYSLPERRKHVRYFPLQEAFAALGGDYSKVGKIISISMGGLSFEYTVFHETSEETSSVEIFLVTGDAHIHHVPCTVVADVQIDANNARGSQLTFLSSRKCRVRFNEMSADRQQELETFIRNYTWSSLKH